MQSLSHHHQFVIFLTEEEGPFLLYGRAWQTICSAQQSKYIYWQNRSITDGSRAVSLDDITGGTILNHGPKAGSADITGWDYWGDARYCRASLGNNHAHVVELAVGTLVLGRGDLENDVFGASGISSGIVCWSEEHKVDLLASPLVCVGVAAPHGSKQVGGLNLGRGSSHDLGARTADRGSRCKGGGAHGKGGDGGEETHDGLVGGS